MEVTVSEKKKWITRFLKNYYSATKENVTFLNELLTSDTLLEKVKFVEDATKCPRGIVIRSSNATGLFTRSFEYYANGVASTNHNKAFNNLLHENQLFYMQLEFKDINKHLEFYDVIENNPYAKENEHKLSDDQIEYINSMMNYSLEQFKLKQLKDRIDKALDVRDKRLFLKLSSRLIVNR